MHSTAFLIFRQVLVGLLMTGSSLCLAIETKTKTLLPLAHDVQAITLAFAHMGTTTTYRLTERDLLRDKACTFEIHSNKKHIVEVVSLLQDNILEEPRGVEQIELRTLVHLQLGSSSTVRVMLGQQQDSGKHVPGEIDNEFPGAHTSVLASASLPNELRLWVSKNLPPQVNSKFCLATFSPSQTNLDK